MRKSNENEKARRPVLDMALVRQASNKTHQQQPEEAPISSGAPSSRQAQSHDPVKSPNHSNKAQSCPTFGPPLMPLLAGETQKVTTMLGPAPGGFSSSLSDMILCSKLQAPKRVTSSILVKPMRSEKKNNDDDRRFCPLGIISVGTSSLPQPPAEEPSGMVLDRIMQSLKLLDDYDDCLPEDDEDFWACLPEDEDGYSSSWDEEDFDDNLGLFDDNDSIKYTKRRFASSKQ